MNYPQELLERYWVFYRAQGQPRRGYTATGCVKPLKIAVDILQRQTRLSNDELVDAIAAELSKLMDRIRHGGAEGYFVLDKAEEVQAISEFTRFFVEDYFRGALMGDRARIAGNKLTTLEHTCEWLYRRKADEIAAQKAANSDPAAVKRAEVARAAWQIPLEVQAGRGSLRIPDAYKAAWAKQSSQERGDTWADGLTMQAMAPYLLRLINEACPIDPPSWIIDADGVTVVWGQWSATGRSQLDAIAQMLKQIYPEQ